MQGSDKRSYILKQIFLVAGWFQNVKPFYYHQTIKGLGDS